jgi:hypothetical protein
MNDKNNSECKNLYVDDKQIESILSVIILILEIWIEIYGLCFRDIFKKFVFIENSYLWEFIWR